MSRRAKGDPHDRLVLVVVGGLLLLALTALGILGTLALRGIDAPDLLLGALVTTLGGTVGALTAVLTQTGRATQDVHVTNTPAQPVPTTPDPDPVGG